MWKCNFRCFDTKNNMKTAVKMMVRSKCMPQTYREANVLLNMHAIAGTPQYNVPKEAFIKAGLDSLPEYCGQQKSVFSPMPIFRNETAANLFRKRVKIPIVEDKATLTTPNAKGYLEKLATEHSITVASEIPAETTGPGADGALTEEQEDADELQMWKLRAKKYRNAYLLWRAYTEVDNRSGIDLEDITTWPIFLCSYDEKIEFPPFKNAEAHESRFLENEVDIVQSDYLVNEYRTFRILSADGKDATTEDMLKPATKEAMKNKEAKKNDADNKRKGGTTITTGNAKKNKTAADNKKEEDPDYTENEEEDDFDNSEEKDPDNTDNDRKQSTAAEKARIAASQARIRRKQKPKKTATKKNPPQTPNKTRGAPPNVTPGTNTPL